ncbi:MAG: response regulator, partial [bacterium]|nr:response regulator [bacterium]
MANKILLIEDEIALRKSLKKLLELKKYQVEEAENIKTAEQKIGVDDYDIFILDLRLPDGNGLDLLKKYKPRMEERTIIVTAHATIPSAVDAIQNGAYYYLEKPLDEELLFIQMEKIVELTQLKAKNLSFKNELISAHSSEEIVYKSKRMEEVMTLAGRLSKSGNSILLQGQ